MVKWKKSILPFIWKKYNRLTIVKEVAPHVYSGCNLTKVECLCDCWKTKEILLTSVKNWYTKSCWCLALEYTKTWDARRSHWLDGTKICRIWYAMKSRCNNKNNNRYYIYWARWIKVHWESFVSFNNDMGKSYYKHVKKYWEWNTTIDRINTNDSYYKENCRWATYKDQANNMTTNKLITYEWTTKTISGWADHFGINYKYFRAQLKKWKTVADFI